MIGFILFFIFFPTILCIAFVGVMTLVAVLEALVKGLFFWVK